jgi:dihydrofolate reductase
MELSLIVAVARNGVIGVDNRLPWRLPGDLKFFKRMTMGKPVIMGRRTWQSIGGKPLPGRPNIVLSSDPAFQAPGGQVVSSISAALTLAEEQTRTESVSESVVIGGSALFAATLPLAQRIYLTEVDAEPVGDVFFPAFDRTGWHETELERADSTGPEGPAYRIMRLDRPV